MPGPRRTLGQANSCRTEGDISRRMIHTSSRQAPTVTSTAITRAAVTKPPNTSAASGGSGEPCTCC